MAENLVKNLVCSKCGAEGRPGAAFCYACGGEIVESAGTQEPPPVKDNGISSAWFRSDITAAESQKLPPLKVQEEVPVEPPKVSVEEKGISGKLKSKVKNNVKKTGQLIPEATAPLVEEAEPPKISPLNKDAAVYKKPQDEPLITKSETAAQNKLKSAASIRQKSKLAEKKRVEVVWAPPQGAPNIWFVAVAIVLTMFAVGILAIMLYIR